jgi:hypothetical protein
MPPAQLPEKSVGVSVAKALPGLADWVAFAAAAAKERPLAGKVLLKV